MNKYKCAVIGVGYLGNFHAQKYTNLPNAELIGVSDIDEKRCEEIAKLCNVTAYKNYEDLIGKVDAVSIVTTTTSHYAIAKKFLENNVHVLLEKPITTTVKEADELIKIAKEKKLIFQIGHLERFNPTFTTIQTQLETPILLEFSRLAPYKVRCTDVSVVLDLMIHDLDLLHTLVKSPIKNIKAEGAMLLSPTIDLAYAHIEFANGAVANLTASRMNSKPERKINLLTKNAYFSGDLDGKTLQIIKNHPKNTIENLTLEKNDALFVEVAAFVDSISKNTAPVVSGEDGKKALETALLIENIIT
jgi:predicted dehydrogenase